MYQEQIIQWCSELENLTAALKVDAAQLRSLTGIITSNAAPKDDLSGEFEQLKKKIASYRSIIALLEGSTIPLDLFMELANAGIYQGSDYFKMTKALERHFESKFAI
jgi:hypothetical protein